MSSFNRVIFVGHLTADPVGKVVGDNKLAQFTMASNRRGKKKDGTVIEDVCFLDVEAWGAQADIVMKFLKKGHSALIEGRLRQARWQAKDGTERNKHVLVCETIALLDQRDSSQREGKESGERAVTAEQASKSTGNKPLASEVNKVMVKKQACFDVGSVDKKNIDEEMRKSEGEESLEDLPF